MIPIDHNSDSDAELDFASAQLPGAQLHQVLASYRRAGPLQPIQFLGQPGLIITGFEALQQAFRDGAKFPPEPIYQMSTEPVMGRTFISMEQAEHNIYRKLTTPAFRSRAVAGQQDKLYADIANQLVDRFIDRGKADLVDSFTRPFPLLVISHMLGLTVTREADFRRWSQDLLSYLHHPESALKAASELGELLQNLIDQRRADPCDDVISELTLTELDGKRLSDEEIIAHIRLLFPTGADTTYLALGNLLYSLLSQGDWWQQLQKTPAMCPAAIEEMLRWEPPAASIPRLSAPRDTRFCGTNIAANSLVLFGIVAANRDPAVFEQPDLFNPLRDSSNKLTFGPGPRTCPGMHLARKELVVALEVLLERLPKLQLLDLDAAQPRGTVLRGPQALHVSW
jgi:cytochrome P450